MCASRCRDPFQHFPDYPDEVFELDCGHQIFVLPCGCRCDDHNHEPCDGRTVAELEEAA